MSSTPPEPAIAATATDPRQPSRRILELDALRALAAINLMLFHFTFVYSTKYGFTSDLGFSFPFGKYGVQLFFMLSGLVNAMTLLKKQQPGQYLQSRAIRILPPFLLVIGLNLFLVQLSPLREHISLTFAGVMANLTTMPGLLGYECLEPVTWTLQVEIQFYFVLLLLFYVGALRKPFWPLMGYLLLCLIGVPLAHGLDPAIVGTAAQTRAVWLTELLLLPYFPLFAIGMFIHQGYLEKGNWGWNGLGILVSLFVFHAIDLRGHNPVVSLFFVGLLVASQYGKLPLLRFKPLLFISGISYSLYLLHNNLGSVFIYYLNQAGVPPWICLGLALAFAIAVSAAAAYWVEVPLGRGIQRLLPWMSKRGGPAPAVLENFASPTCLDAPPSR